ncbi:hypothetical protein TNCV_267021 [Trichonephila clavipes]|nr:hypothetical protein TNCV_267021 [Trichonephila clavipes]
MTGDSETLSSGTRDRESDGLSEHNNRLLCPYMAFVSPTGNGIFLQDSIPRQKARIVLEGFEEHEEEFHSIF